MSRHNPDTAAYEKAIRELHSRVWDWERVGQGLLVNHQRTIGTPNASTDFCHCPLCRRCRELLDEHGSKVLDFQIQPKD